MTTLTIILPHPPDAVKPNSRVHFMKKAAATKYYRRLTWTKACALIKGQPPRWQKASMQVHAYFKTMNFPDPGNLMASLKAAEDGLQDAGVVNNDRALWPLRPQFAKDAQNPRIELIITEEP